MVPVGVGKEVGGFQVDIVDACAAVFGFNVAGKGGAGWIIFCVFTAGFDSVRNEGFTDDAAEGLGDVYAGQDVAQAATYCAAGVTGAGFEFLGDAVSDQALTSGVLNFRDAFRGGAGELEHFYFARFEERVKGGFGVGVEIGGFHKVGFIDDDEDELVGEEGFDAAEESHLGVNGVATLFGEIHEIEDGGAEMGDGGDGLHFNSVHFLEWMVEDSGGIYGLESKVFVVEMTNEERFGGESVGLNVDVCSGHTSQEARLPDIGVAADKKCTCIWINGWKTAEMLAYLLEIYERVFQPPTYGGHSPQGSALELFALE